MGDLAEEFETRVMDSGVGPARRWYWSQFVRSVPSMIRRCLARRPFRHGADTGDMGKLTLEAVMADLRSAIRSLYAAPGFTFIALVVLTLGIGATTAIFSVVDAVVLRGLPFDEHDRLVAVGEQRPLVPGEVKPVDADPEALMSVAPQNYSDCAARQESSNRWPQCRCSTARGT
jgi:hypothetical protein